MDDFEEAVETQTLPQFLKQDADATSSSVAPTVGEAELERLMREMSETDLDALASELGVEGAGKVGLLVPEGATGEPLSGRGSDALESEGVKGTVEKVVNPDLESEKKLAEAEIGGRLPVEEQVKEESGVGDVAAQNLNKLGEASGGTVVESGGAVAGKEKLD